MSGYDELISEHRARCMCAPHCSVPEECDMCSKEKCISCMSADALDAAQSKLIVLRNTIVGLRNALEFVDYHISRDNTEAKEAIRIAVRSAKEAEK